MEGIGVLFNGLVERVGFEIAVISIAFSFIRSAINITGILKFSNNKTIKRILLELFLEIPLGVVSFLIAIFTGYFLLGYIKDHDLPDYVAYGWTGLSGILGSNIVSSMINLNFDGIQGFIDKKIGSK